MGKIKTRILGLEEVEEKQKKEQKEKAAQKKAQKKKEKVEEKKQEEVKKPEVKKPEKKTTQQKPRGKRYEENKKIVNRTKVYPLAEAISLLKKMKTTSFDESVELHLVVEEQGLKGEVELPHSTGKTVRVAIVDDKVLAAIEAGKIDFDVLITHPSYMPKLAKFAKVLGPKGLMPNPKAGTISPNPEEVAKKFQKGVLRWKTEPKAALIHQMIGKISMKEEEIKENIEAFLKSVGAKNIKKAYLKTTMSPSVKIEIEI